MIAFSRNLPVTSLPGLQMILVLFKNTGIITLLSYIWEWVSCLSRYHLVSYCGCRSWSDAASSIAFIPRISQILQRICELTVHHTKWSLHVTRLQTESRMKFWGQRSTMPYKICSNPLPKACLFCTQIDRRLTPGGGGVGTSHVSLYRGKTM
jgi:hypothetical protein